MTWSITFTITGYGPTNETLGKYIRELFGQMFPRPVADSKGSTQIMRTRCGLRTRAVKSVNALNC